MLPDPQILARELSAAFTNRRLTPTPSSRYTDFDLASAYAVERELVRQRKMQGHASVGRKVGYANKALWRMLKLDTVVWAHMYDDTVQYAHDGEAVLSIARMTAPKIEPEIVVKLKDAARPFDGGSPDAAAALGACEWIALGFEIIDCVFPGWQFQPADFVAAYGLHAALIVGEQRPVDATMLDALPRFTVKLLKNGQLAAEGSGRNVLRSPAASLAELAAAATRAPHEEPLAGGEIISTGTTTESQPIASGETWTAELAGLSLASLTVRVTV
jgi:2-oxo-3-hexenedioate decarboxylase